MKSSSDDKPPSRRSAWKWALRLVIGVLIVAAVLRGNSATAVWPVLQRVSPLLLIGAVFIYEVGQLLSALRWRWIFNALRPAGSDGALSMGAAARIYFAGMFWNLWMPTGIGGDAFRAYAAARQLPPQSSRMVTGATSVLLDRVVGLCALLAVCAVGIGLDGRGAHSGAPKVLWAAIGALLTTACLLWAARGALRRLTMSSKAPRWAGRWNEIEAIVEQLAARERRPIIWSALGLSLAVQALQIAINWGLARAVGLPLPPATFIWLGPALALSSLLPLGIGGLGVREAAAVALLKGSGAPVGTIVAWSLLWQATLWLSSLPGGVWALNARFENADS